MVIFLLFSSLLLKNSYQTYDVENRKVLDEYLPEAITLGVNEISNYDEDESALKFMGKKHHNIKVDICF
jgi:hypothetical protein